ncbi:MarR family transcriptional regulator [Cytophagaceae bacterium YF14B1]|uniref:MarR family transcriptional regulator n=1 Tax=Xanthocytophaga flava TaxID=3048013 RepID=A0AAE3QPJ6_9BACT|nr:MarR family transcriptional regulator [Xanthocytophaga flavus]MDJ1480534.1 MarR family transcriptional regulator [Xanthocytophaga flavus]
MDPNLISSILEFKSKRNRILGRLLNKSYRYITALASEFLKKEGYDNFKVAHVIILIHIDVEEGLMINTIAQQIGVTKQAISKIIKELLEEGYVYAEKHPTDARASLIRLSEKGAHFMLAWQRCTDHIDNIFKDIVGSKRLEQLKDILGEITEHYEGNMCRIDNDQLFLQ